jgi:lipopolysaccharide/colanic/teichoic acid biosynthesis glycosyltransferase
MQNQSSQIFRLGTLVIDGVLIVCLFVAVSYWRFADLRISNPEYYNYYLQLFVLTFVSWYASGRWARTFTYSSGLEQRNVLANVLRGAIAQFAILSIIVVGLKGYYYSRLFLGTYFGLLYGTAIMYRLLFVQFLRNQMAKGRWQRTFILVGNHGTAKALIDLVKLRPDLGLQHHGTLDIEALQNQDFPKAQELVCALAPSTNEYVVAQDYALKQGMRFRYLPDMGPNYVGQLFLESLEGFPLFSERKDPLSNGLNKVIKRLFDVTFTVLGIVLVLSWILPLFAIILVISGAGFPFFTQRREGLEGRKFTVIKFRTINSKGSSNAIQRWMRKLGIDELPQLFNVLVGQMSLIGPRPHTEGDGFNYAAKIRQYKIRHWAKPGLTGLAQTRGLRGGEAAADQGLLEARIRADIYYIENWSLLLDMRLLLETVLRTVFLPTSLHKK